MNDDFNFRTGVVHSEQFKEHQTGDGHPESPSRINAIARALEAPSLSGRLTYLAARPAKREEILLVHTQRHYEEVLASQEQELVHFDEDTVTSRGSAEVALLAVGAVLVCVDAVSSSQVDNAFAFVRPPGHHAKPDKAMGSCLFNNVAIGAQYALRNWNLKRVLVVDFDIHHGNGTQKAFYTSPQVLYISTHQWPQYPGTGGLEEKGKDAGEGFTINVPLTAGMGDSEYLRVYREIVGPVGREFSPDLVLVSAGFDAHHQDPLGSMSMSHRGYAAVTREIMDIAETCCGGKVVFSLEGGYNLAGLEKSIVSVLEMTTGTTRETGVLADNAAGGLIGSVRHAYGDYWRCLRDKS